jgi:TPR repeat protein
MRSFVSWSLLALLFAISPLAADNVNLPAVQAAAAKGDPVAEQELGRAYHLGQGVPVDYAKALDLYKKSAAQGNAKAMNNLGIMYHRGSGVPVNDKEASKWLLQAAEKDYAPSELAVGLGYWAGDLGFAHDLNSAEKWLSKAAAHSDEPEVMGPAANALGALYQYRQGTSKTKPDYEKALFWYNKAADLNNAKAQTNLGLIYGSDLVGKKDIPTSYYWLRLSSANGDPPGIHALSDLLAASVLTDAQIAEGDRKALAFRADHHIDGPLPPPPHLMTPDSLEIEKAREKSSLSASGAASNAAPSPAEAPVGTGTK